MCRQCRAVSQESYKNHREERLADIEAWQGRNPEKMREASKRYYETHTEACRARANAYHELHREEINQKAREKKACELCGRLVSSDGLKRHQATRLCEKNRP